MDAISEFIISSVKMAKCPRYSSTSSVYYRDHSLGIYLPQNSHKCMLATLSRGLSAICILKRISTLSNATSFVFVGLHFRDISLKEAPSRTVKVTCGRRSTDSRDVHHLRLLSVAKRAKRRSVIVFDNQV